MILKFENLSIYYNKFSNKKNKGVPLLFLHGWGVDSSSFKFFYENLKNEKTCIVIDFPPFGKSSMPNKEMFLKDYAKIVLNLLEKLKISKVDIVAHSFGGRVAIELASRCELVNKLLLTGSAGLKVFSLKRFLKIKKYKILKTLAKLKLYSKSKLNLQGSLDYVSLKPCMRKTFINVVNYNQKDLLKRINVPTLLVWGTLDKETPFCFTKIFKKHIKDCEIVRFENCSHFAYLEKPQLFLKILKSFFCNLN